MDIDKHWLDTKQDPLASTSYKLWQSIVWCHICQYITHRIERQKGDRQIYQGMMEFKEKDNNEFNGNTALPRVQRVDHMRR